MPALGAQESVGGVLQQGRTRLTSLDAMRGLAVAGMILVNNPGSWTDGYRFLAHSKWNGWTGADLVFPFFLLIGGVSIDLALSRQVAGRTAPATILSRVVRRAFLLFALGLLLNGFPDYRALSSLRLFGVLQRIAACYLAGCVVFLAAGAAGQIAIALGLVAAYWMALTLVPVPGVGAGVLRPDTNLVGYVDNLLFHGHLYRDGFDPEGLLSTLPAIATTIIGMLAGRWLRARRDPRVKAIALGVVGGVFIAAGEVVKHWLPINKQLWTPSFVLLTGGIGLVTLALCHELIDRRRWTAPAAPFLVLGTNALSVYLLSSLVARVMELWHVGADETCESLRLFLYEHLFASWAGTLRGSLLFAVAYLLVWMATAASLYRRQIFLRL